MEDPNAQSLALADGDGYLEPDTAETPDDLEATEEVVEAAPPTAPPRGGGGVTDEEEDAKKKCKECVPGAPAWLATFGDLMSLLVAFFVLILSFSDINVPKHKQISGSLKEAFGIQRLVPVVEPPKATSLIAKEFSPTVSQPTVVNTIRQITTDDMQRDLEVKTETKTYDEPTPEEVAKVEQALAKEIAEGKVDVRVENNQLVLEVKDATGTGGLTAGESGEAKGAQLDSEQLQTFAKIAEIERQIDSEMKVVAPFLADAGQDEFLAREEESDNIYQRLRAELSNEIAQGLAEVEKEGDQVIVRLADQGSFESGRADLQAGFLPLLRSTGSVLAAGDGKIEIQGHTDNVPVLFNPRFQSNWDLSAARAASVADFMVGEFGLTDGRVTVSGFADTLPIATNETAEGRAANRRIEIIVEPR